MQPYPTYTLIHRRADEVAFATLAAFPSDLEAASFAKWRLKRRPEERVSLIVAAGRGYDLRFVGVWDRSQDGALTWESATLA